MITDNGLRMPKLGLGTFRMKGPECSEAVLGALARGYRHIDTAFMYGNEDAVGEAVELTTIPREDFHLTTKVWWDQLAPDAMQASIERSLTALKTDYVDLFLIHWPTPDMDLAASLGKLVNIKEQGLARHIGVCNFPLGLLRRAVEEVQAPIEVHQFEYHVLIDQSKLVNYCRSKGIAVTAYVPLAQGRLAEHPALGEIAKKHNATAAQVALKWLLDQDGVSAIPKASRVESQTSNFEAQKLELDDADRAVIAGLPKGQRFVSPPFAPDWNS